MDEHNTHFKRRLGLGGLGAGTLGVITFLFNHVTQTTEQLRAEVIYNMQMKEASVREYVDLKHEHVMRRLDDMNLVLKTIDGRIYEIHRITKDKGVLYGNTKD